jgi:hypothetical protein
MSEQPLSEILDAAADYLEQFGWDKGGQASKRFGSPTCVMGAISMVRYRMVENLYGEYDAAAALYEAIGLPKPAATDPQPRERMLNRVVDWNDLETTDAQSVLDALRKAAKEQRIKEEA